MVHKITITQHSGEWLLTWVRGKTLYRKKFVFFSDVVSFVEHELLGG